LISKPNTIACSQTFGKCILFYWLRSNAHALCPCRFTRIHQ
jgi:hypothetical protein